MLEDFVALVTEAVPQLLTDRQRRAKVGGASFMTSQWCGRSFIHDRVVWEELHA